MADKQTEADKALALKEYRARHDAALDRIAALKAARLKRDAAASKRDAVAPKRDIAAKPAKKSTKR